MSNHKGVTVRLSVSVHKKIKVFAAKNSFTISEAIDSLLN